MSCVYRSGKPATNVRILWIWLWKARKSEMHCHRILRALHAGSRNTFTVGKRASSGVTRDVGGAGKPVPSADAWHWRAVRSAKETPGNWPGLARRDQAGSPPSHTWRGPCLILRGTGDSIRTETPARTRIPVVTAICRTPRRIIRRRRRTLPHGLRAGRASGVGTLPDGFRGRPPAAGVFRGLSVVRDLGEPRCLTLPDRIVRPASLLKKISVPACHRDTTAAPALLQCLDAGLPR
jgi:hypothetical protein